MSDSDADIDQLKDELQDELRELQEQLGISYQAGNARRVRRPRRTCYMQAQ